MTSRGSGLIPYLYPQQGFYIDTGAQLWDLRHTRFAGGLTADMIEGTADCRLVWQAAIDDPEVTRIFCPNGDYQYSGAINILIGAAQAGLEIIGAGSANCKITYTPPNDATRRACFLLDNTEGITISGIEITHTSSSSVDRFHVSVKQPDGVTPVHGYGIERRNCNNCTIENCVFYGGVYGIFDSNTVDDNTLRVWTTNENNRTSCCKFYNQYNAGMYLSHSQGAIITYNYAEGCGYDGFKSTGINCLFDISHNKATGCGRDGFDCYPIGLGGQFTHNMAWENSEFGFELKGLLEDGEYGLRETIISDLIAYNNGGIASWSNPAADGQPQLSITAIRAAVLTNILAIGGFSAGIRITACQGLTCIGWKCSRNAKQGISTHSSSRLTFIGCDVLDPGYVDGTTPAVGTHDAWTFAVGSSLHTLIGCKGTNSTAKPGGCRYAITFDNTCSGNIITTFNANSTLTGTFAEGTAVVAADGSVTMNGAFNITVPYTKQVIVGHQTTSYRGTQSLTSTKIGVRNVSSNAEFGLERTDGSGTVVSDLLIQIQAALVLITSLENVPIRFGTHGAGRIELDANGNWSPLATTQDLGTSAIPWAKGYFLGTWNNPIYFGGSAVWVGASGGLYLKGGIPSSDSDGTLLLPSSLLAISNTWDLAQIFTSTAVFNGATPFTLTGTGQINNLNANYLQGQLGAFYLALANATGTLPWSQVSKSGAVASDVAALASASLPIKRVTANVIITASATIALTDLDLTVVSGEEWSLIYRIKVNPTAGTAGYQFRITHPGGTGSVKANGTTTAATTVTNAALTTNVTSPITIATTYISGTFFAGWLEVELAIKFSAGGTVSVALLSGVAATGNILAESWLLPVRLSP